MGLNEQLRQKVSIPRTPRIVVTPMGGLREMLDRTDGVGVINAVGGYETIDGKKGVAYFLE